MDKLSNGVVIQLIQLFAPICDADTPSDGCKLFYKLIMTYVPGVCVIIIFVMLLCLNTKRLGERRRRMSEDNCKCDCIVV